MTRLDLLRAMESSLVYENSRDVLDYVTYWPVDQCWRAVDDGHLETFTGYDESAAADVIWEFLKADEACVHSAGVIQLRIMNALHRAIAAEEAKGEQR